MENMCQNTSAALYFCRALSCQSNKYVGDYYGELNKRDFCFQAISIFTFTRTYSAQNNLLASN